MEKKKGSVIFIHRNGKVGNIKTESGKVIGFHKKNLVRRVKKLSLLEKAKVSFYDMEVDDGKFNAEDFAKCLTTFSVFYLSDAKLHNSCCSRKVFTKMRLISQ